MNAFLAAATALGRSHQKPIRRYDERPTRPQPASRMTKHEHQHREHEQVQVGEEAPFLAVAVHVPDRVGVDQEPDAGDDEQHDHGERVDEDRHVRLERPG
jgi:hypothetical protein